MWNLASYIKIFPLVVITIAGALAQDQKQPPTPAVDMSKYFAYINRKVLDMAQDFPADKYDFRLRPEMRSFRESIVHIASGNVYAAKAGRSEKVSWDELDAKNYPTKADAVGLLQKSI
jgi:hypothetical protein